MKRYLKITLFTIIFIIAMFASKNVLADEISKATVTYGDFTDSGITATITFSSNVSESSIELLTENGWSVNGNTATMTTDKYGAYYIYNVILDQNKNEEAVVTIPMKLKVGEYMTLDNKFENITVKDTSLATVSGNKITANKAGKTTYSAKVSVPASEIISGGDISIAQMLDYNLTWNLLIESNGDTPENPTNKEATVTYGEPTSEGVLVTITFSKDIPSSANIGNWTVSGNQATRTMAPGSVAEVSITYEDGSTEKATVAVPVTLDVGGKIDLNKMATDLKIADTNIATVENGILTAISSGTTTMTGKAIKTGAEYTWKITVRGSESTGEKQDKDQNGSGDKQPGNGSEGTSGNDKTTSNKVLSQTGTASIIPIFLALAVIVAISYKKYKEYKNK